MQIDILEVLYDKNYKEDIQEIRTKVFILEQKIDKEIEFDGEDKNALHTLIYFDNKAVATGRILKDGKIGRVAVLKDYRKKGLGEKIINSLITQGKNNDFKEVYLDSQEDAIKFYEKLGFVINGEMFTKANIKHQKMVKTLK